MLLQPSYTWQKYFYYLKQFYFYNPKPDITFAAILNSAILFLIAHNSYSYTSHHKPINSTSFFVNLTMLLLPSQTWQFHNFHPKLNNSTPTTVILTILLIQPKIRQKYPWHAKLCNFSSVNPNPTSLLLPSQTLPSKSQTMLLLVSQSKTINSDSFLSNLTMLFLPP